MAIFHLSVKVISRAAGRSAVAAAAYRSADRLHDERLDRAHDFTNKSGVVHSEVLLPENAPDKWQVRERLWNDVEAFEKRKDAQLSREVEFAIPREMNESQGIELARDFVQREFVDQGMAADLNVHWDIGADGLAKPHAHVMLTMREIVVGEDGEVGFGAKVRDWNRTELVEQWRERWADHVNERLAQLDIDARIDHRSLEAQGIDLEPQNKIGAAASRMAEQGLEIDRADEHLEIARSNGNRLIANPSLALDTITHSQATFTNRDLAMFVHRHSAGTIQYDAVMSAVKASPDLIALGKDGRGEERFTSRDMIETEQRLSQATAVMAERERHRVSDAHRKGALSHAAERGLELSGEQRAAFDHVTGERDLSLVVGYAGTGKSAMLGAAREAWESAGLEVRGAALSGIAAEGLEHGSGIASRTIASLEHGWSQDRDLLTSRDVLVIDEAGMVGTRQMERVMSHAADAGAKVVLVGDPQQLQAIEAGAAFRSIHEHHGGVEITELRRQHQSWQSQATRELATGRTADAVRAYDDAGMVHATDTREAARTELIERWDRDRQANPNDSRIILTHTNAEVRELNEAARDAMRASGDLGADVHLKVKRGDRSFATGDRIMFLQGERSLEVKNGTLGTIERVSEQHMAVRTDDGRRVAFDTKTYRDLDHGYAATIHKAQGMTVDKTHVLATPGVDRHGTYVGLSRHRQRVDVYYARSDFSSQNKLVQALARERPKDMAQDYSKADPARAFAEQRGITFRERVAEIVRKVPEKARGIFDHFRPKVEVEPKRDQDMFANFRPAPRSHEPERGDRPTRDLPRMRADPVRSAVERYAKALDAALQTRARGLEPMPHQRVALDRAKDALDAVRPHASTDLRTAFERQPALVREAAEGRSQAAIHAMSKEADIRTDPYSRADRFVEDWQRLQQGHGAATRSGARDHARVLSSQMGAMAKSLERDAQLESVLRGRSRELGLEVGRELSRSLSRDLANSIPFDHVRDLGRGMGMSL